jgi:hypothetical protein
MANKSRFIVAESSIKSFFRGNSKKVFKKSHLEEVLTEKRLLWNLPDSMNVDKFLEKLLDRNILFLKEISFDGYLAKKERYVAEDASVFQIAVSLANKSYLSHYSAIYLHGLTTQVPKTIYISFEQSKKIKIERKLEQHAIDNAFTKPQRKTIASTVYEGYTFLMHNGMYSNRTGVYTANDLPVTNIERTLIDITVRPGYAGGVSSVLDAYRKSIDRISINKITAILDNLDFIYPYHQSVGFYLEKAGYDIKKLEVLRKRPMPFNFYLTYEMSETDYSNDWKLYYPKGM